MSFTAIARPAFLARAGIVFLAGTIASLFVLLASVSSAAALTCTFTGAVDNDYNNSGNWDCGAAPTSTTDVVIPTSFDVSATSSVAGNSLSLAAGATMTSVGASMNFGTASSSGVLVSGLGLIFTGSVTNTGSISSQSYTAFQDLVNSGTITTQNTGEFLGSVDNSGTIFGFGDLLFATTTNSGTITTSGTTMSVSFAYDLVNTGTIDVPDADVSINADLDNTGGTFTNNDIVRFVAHFSHPENASVIGGVDFGDARIRIDKESQTLDVVGGNVTTTGFTIIGSGTLQLNGNTWTASSWDNTGGTLDVAATGTVRIADGTFTTIGSESGFYNLVVDSAVAKDLVGDITVANVLSVLNGRLDANDQTITIKRTGTGADMPFVSATDDFSAGSSTVIFTGENPGLDPNDTHIPGLNFFNLTLSGTGIDYALTASTTVMGPDTLTIAAGDTLDVDFVLTVVGSIVNLGVINLNSGAGGQIIHPAESIAITDSSGTAVSTVNSGGRLYVTLEDSNRNLNGTVIETVTTTVSGDATAGSDSETITLTETSASSGIFRNTTGLEVIGPSSATAGNGRLEVSGNGVLTATYTDNQDPSDVATDTASASTSPATTSTPSTGGGGGGGGVTGPIYPPTSTAPSLPLDLLPVPVHSLVKLPCVGFPGINDPCKAVYYVGADGRRHAFPHEKVYYTWYANFDGVQLIGEAQMASMPLGANVTYKPGVKMVKFMTDPKVYAVEKGGVLRWVTTESLAIALYGSLWNTRIDDISDAFYGDYRFGADITSTSDYSPATAEASVTFPSDSLQM